MNNTGLKFYVVEKDGEGHLKRIGSTPVKEVARQIEKLLDAHKLPYEYVSCVGWESKCWPIGDRQIDYCWLEIGGNEGYSLYIATRYKKGWHTDEWFHDQPIRIKLLTTTDDAWRVTRFVMENLDCW